jgi:hypothetical protein
MRNLIIIIIIASLAIVGLISPGRAEMATRDEGMTVAKNWITLIIQKKGDWGGSETAELEEIQEFKRGERILGYFCAVKPRGFIVISLRKELAPVKAYSTTCDLDPESDEGLADIIKGGMERVLNRIEQRLGPLDKVRTEELGNFLEINYRQAWEELERGGPGLDMNYQEGNVLLSSNWHQEPPYNDQCPNKSCSWPPCYYNQNALVGCVATAGAQIMRYWNWPPYGVGSPYSDPYDWPNMPDVFTGCTWSQARVDAVAELCHEVGVAVDMSYGCVGSSANTYDMEDVYENHYRYSTACAKENRKDYSAVDWFNRMKAQFNVNRPVQYRIPDHSIVGDGWQEFWQDSEYIRQYHMNWGHGDNKTWWYTLDEIPGSNPDDEYMLEDIYPAQALGSWLSAIYSLQSFPYRYFDQDATGSSATFESGQNLQFLPNIDVTCTSTTGGSICFYGSTANNTRFFTRGDMSTGIRIYNGAIKLTHNGSITFH